MDRTCKVRLLALAEGLCRCFVAPCLQHQPRHSNNSKPSSNRCHVMAVRIAQLRCCCDAPGEAHTLFNAGGGVNGSDLLLEVTFTPARHGEQLFETLAGQLCRKSQQGCKTLRW